MYAGVSYERKAPERIYPNGTGRPPVGDAEKLAVYAVRLPASVIESLRMSGDSARLCREAICAAVKSGKK